LQRQRGISSFSSHSNDLVVLSNAFENTPFRVRIVYKVCQDYSLLSFQNVFPYAVLNSMQSQCFPFVFRSDESIVVSGVNY